MVDQRELDDTETAHRLMTMMLRLYGCRAVLAALVTLIGEIARQSNKAPSQVAQDILTITKQEKILNLEANQIVPNLDK